LAFDISQNLSSLTWEIVVGELDVQVVIHVGNYEDNMERGGGAVKEIEESDILMDRKKKKKDVSL